MLLTINELTEKTIVNDVHVHPEAWNVLAKSNVIMKMSEDDRNYFLSNIRFEIADSKEEKTEPLPTKKSKKVTGKSALKLKQ